MIHHVFGQKFHPIQRKFITVKTWEHPSKEREKNSNNPPLHCRIGAPRRRLQANVDGRPEKIALRIEGAKERRKGRRTDADVQRQTDLRDVGGPTI